MHHMQEIKHFWTATEQYVRQSDKSFTSVLKKKKTVNVNVLLIIKCIHTGTFALVGCKTPNSYTVVTSNKLMLAL